MAKTVTATFSDGRTLTWTDGVVDGDPLLLRALPHMAGVVEVGQAMPEGPNEQLSRFEESPAAFAALVQVVRPGSLPTVETSGGVVLAEPPPADAN